MRPERDPAPIVDPEPIDVDPIANEAGADPDADASEAVDTGDRQHVVLLSGLSGAGKTAAAKLFEDLGYAVVDNLPGELLPNLAELVSTDRTRYRHVAIVLDVRAGDAESAYRAMRGADRKSVV